ncbi:MAG TPA: mandelate racemase/muconate lactonizing enzyme family protein [Ramlibacter sp.]|uniref:mandelate racemase/muconate lactonizing enzyme family protein n=1 Tax=Ramlibacter sp. TaxID=1917967 RepID=UPI002B90EECF|nr:mandelate racemase/muconate lactonizing enzyme family protein [Ramlibacter sp.]HVZ44887.1 mandelate racemase/muconate lactonizing enzyme family protein [Ramlibacter sp.]
MPKIASIQVAVARVPLDKVTSFATRTVKARDYALVKVRSEDGHEGIGFCYVGSTGGPIAMAAVKELLAPVLLGQESRRSEGLWNEMYKEAILQGRAGTVMRGISILDTALWDMNARAAGVPLTQYMGCWSTTSVPAYASGGYYVEGKTPAHLGDEMRGYVEAGFRAVKMKVGRFSPREEEARVRAARQAVGEDVELMLDANNAWSDLPTALRYVERFEQYDPYFIEEPFSPDDIANHARLARSTRIMVATGEIEVGRWRFKELLDQGGAQILQTDAAVCGGITEWRRIAALADAYGVTICPHWFHDLHVHLVASAANSRYVEYFLDDQVLNFKRLVNRQLEFKQGNLLVPTGPGLGFEFDEQAVSRYALGEGWVNCR